MLNFNNTFEWIFVVTCTLDIFLLNFFLLSFFRHAAYASTKDNVPSINPDTRKGLFSKIKVIAYKLLVVYYTERFFYYNTIYFFYITSYYIKNSYLYKILSGLSEKIGLLMILSVTLLLSHNILGLHIYIIFIFSFILLTIIPLLCIDWEYTIAQTKQKTPKKQNNPKLLYYSNVLLNRTWSYRYNSLIKEKTTKSLRVSFLVKHKFVFFKVSLISTLMFMFFKTTLLLSSKLFPSFTNTLTDTLEVDYNPWFFNGLFHIDLLTSSVFVLVSLLFYLFIHQSVSFFSSSSKVLELNLFYFLIFFFFY